MTSLSRLEKLGTIFTRIRDLMRAGVLKEANKPLWYDVMAAFPPKDDPTYHREYKKDFLPEILYEEDAVRSQFYKVYGNQVAIDLTKHEDVKLSPCHRFITKYQELQKEDGRPAGEIFEATAAALAQEGLVLKKQSDKRRPRRKKEEAKPDSRPITKGLALLLQQALENQNRQARAAAPTAGTPTTGRDGENER